MDLSEALIPAINEALKAELSYDEFRQACLRTYVNTALKQCGNVQHRAAIKLRTTPATISRTLRGKLLTGTGIPGPKPKNLERE